MGNRITPAASEGVIDARGMVPRLCREFFLTRLSNFPPTATFLICKQLLCFPYSEQDEQMEFDTMLKLNGDVGESFGRWQMGQDASLIPLLDMANIACGFHASDPDNMVKTIDLCVTHSVTIGAHPGYADKEGFGRRSIPMTANELIHSMLYQIGALKALAEYRGSNIGYFKPHGALYHDMMQSDEILKCMLTVSATIKLPVMVLATCRSAKLLELANQYGATLIFEAFADRRYLASGLLAPRSLDGAVLHNDTDILKQVSSLITHQSVETINGQTLTLNAQTLCVHGDNEASIHMAKTIRSLIDSQGDS
ncbi:LamB/YcsF family protein [Vibrio thalassae]|uniref:LamB/YcsF family protein n=2 Tax=Vibrio thalassae TaxID=1243014 RepID=A0A240EF61_9VIBR|nr:5-oxoprolinase subunit PxpA [Vibrio thalassae]SNX47317.1 LamB/YcsF family protein [Vibrio thalassae]